MAPFLRDASRGEGPGFARHVPNMVQPVTINNLHRPVLGWNPYPRASIENRILGNIRSAASGQSRLL